MHCTVQQQVMPYLVTDEIEAPKCGWQQRALRRHLQSQPCEPTPGLLDRCTSALSFFRLYMTVNAMLGARYCEEGVLPTTAKITVLRKGKGAEVERGPYRDPINGTPLHDVEDVRVPVEWLNEVNTLFLSGKTVKGCVAMSLVAQIAATKNIFVAGEGCAPSSVCICISRAEILPSSDVHQWRHIMCTNLCCVDRTSSCSQRLCCKGWITIL